MRIGCSAWHVGLLCAISFGAVRAGDFALVEGHVYGVINGGLREYDSDLNFVADLILPQVTVTEGLAFTAEGHLVFSGFRQLDHFVFEIDTAGAVVHFRDLDIGSLDRAAHLDIDASGRIYTATFLGMVEVLPDFSAHAFLDHDFERASGVVVGSDDKLYVTDESTGELVIFDAARAVENAFYVGFVPTGLYFDAEGNLLCTIFGSQQLVEIDLVNESTSILLSGLEGASDIAFAADGSYYLSIDAGNILEHRSADHELLVSVPTGDFTDAIVVMNPAVEPMCDGDVNGDSTVDPLDTGYVLARFGCAVGTGDPDCDAADANDDGLVDPLDAGYVQARFGDCP